MKKLLAVLLPSLLLGQTNIYRSIQFNNTSALAVGTSNSVTISSGTATFTSALPDTIGVGDAIQYDDDADGDIDANDSIAFISARTSSTIFTIKTAAGVNPTDATDTDWSIFRAYINITNAEAGTENTGIDADLVNFDAGNVNIDAANQKWYFALYNSAFTAGANWSGWTTSSTDRIVVFTPYLPSQVGTRQRHLGIYSAAYSRIEVTNSGAFVFLSAATANDLTFEGLQVSVAGGASANGGVFNCGFASGTYEVSYCILRGANANVTTNGDHNAIVFGGSGSVGKAWNNIIYNWIAGNTPNDHGIRLVPPAASFTAYVYSNTVYNCAVGIDDEGANANSVMKNNLCASNAVDFVGADAGCEYNASSDGTAPGTNSRTSQTFTFVSVGSDFHLASTDTGAKGFGKDLSADANLAFSDDIDNDARGATWSIGADHGFGTVITTFLQKLRRRIIWWQ